MCSNDSATAPEFFLHHGFVDKIWADWQKRGHTFRNAYFPLNPSLMAGSLNGNRYYTTDFIDVINQPGNVRVEYGKPPPIARGKRVVLFSQSKGILSIILTHSLLGLVYFFLSDRKEGSVCTVKRVESETRNGEPSDMHSELSPKYLTLFSGCSLGRGPFRICSCV